MCTREIKFFRGPSGSSLYAAVLERERELGVCVCYTDYRYRREKFNMRVEAIIRAMGLDESLEVDQLPGEAISIRKMAEGGAEVEE